MNRPPLATHTEHVVMDLARIAEGIVGVVTLGFVRPQWSVTLLHHFLRRNFARRRVAL